MTKLTFATALFAAALAFTVLAAPVSARSAASAPQKAPHARAQHVEKAPPAFEAARAAFLQSLAQEDGKPGAPAARRPMNTKMAPVACTGDGGMTTCCGPCGCCTWSGFGDGAHCASNC